MTQAIVFSSLAILLLILLIVLARSALTSSRVGEPWPNLLQESGENTLPPLDLVSRLFDSQDLEFVAEQGCEFLTSFITKERRRIALNWLAAINWELTRIVAEHRRVVRTSAAFRCGVEFRLFQHWLQFRLFHLILFLLLVLYGPAVTGATCRQFRMLCEHIIHLFTLLLIDVRIDSSGATANN